MKTKTLYPIMMLLASMLIPASCSKSTNPDIVPDDALVLSFTTDDEVLTKTTSTSTLSLTNGCTAAFYSKSDGHLAASGSCEGSTNRIVITSVPTCNCNVYAVGNTSFEWPSNSSELASQQIPITVMSGPIPRSTLIDEYEWLTSSPRNMRIIMHKMYSKISIKRNQPDSVSFTATSARVTKCANVIYPFGSTSTGTEGYKDMASDGDLQLFNNDQEFYFYVPSEGQTEVEITGIRKNRDPFQGQGISYNDTYTVTVPAITRDDKHEEEILVNGTTGGSSSVIVITFPDDTRAVTFGTANLEVTGDNTAYTTTVKGQATNGETNWNYKLFWTGNSALAGNTTISIDGITKNLGVTDSSAALPGNGSFKNISVTSSYSGTTPQTVRLYSNVNNSYMDITVTKKVITRTLTGLTVDFSYNNTSLQNMYSTKHYANAYGKAVVKAQYSDGSEENISSKTKAQGLTINSTIGDGERKTDFVMFYPSEKSFGGVGSATFTYTEDGVTKSATVNNMKYGAVLKQLRFDADNGNYVQYVDFFNGSKHNFSWQNCSTWSGYGPYIQMNISSAYTGANFKVYAVNVEGEEQEIFSGYVNTNGGTGTGTITSYNGKYYYVFQNYYDYSKGYCFHSQKP